jgi:antitoxin component YwqK of YwqJK toxin-antitoxin module
MYYKNGKIREAATWTNGKRNGITQIFDSMDDKNIIINYSDGIQMNKEQK